MPYTPARGHRAGGGVWLVCVCPMGAWWLIAGEGHRAGRWWGVVGVRLPGGTVKCTSADGVMQA